MVMEKFDARDPEASERFRKMFGPEQIDHMVRQAISFCWMALPEKKQNVVEVERQIRRIVDRALKDLREDRRAFGLGA
jgi:hypothetical protein